MIYNIYIAGTIVTISLRAYMCIRDASKGTARAIDIFQTASLGLSFLTNVTATAAILITFWYV